MNFFKKPEDVTDAKVVSEAFPDIGDDKGLEDHVPAADAAPAGSVEELSKRFDEYKEDSNTRETRLLDALANASAPALPVANALGAVTVEPFKPTDLPDAVEHPEEYAKILTANIEGSVQHKMDTAAAEAANNNAGNASYDGMWDTFKEKYEDLAKHEELVEIHAGRVAKSLAAQGIDVPTYMTQNPDRFLGDVAKSVGERLTQLGLGPKEDGERPDPMTDTGRTGGLPGSGAATEPAKNTATPTQGGFISEIQKTQKDMGLI